MGDIRDLIRHIHSVHPSETLIREAAHLEHLCHIAACETRFSQESYEFTDADGTLWRQWICWCGSGTYVERIKQ